MPVAGMLDPAFFVGRKELLEWLNGFLQLNLSKVEETFTGAVACQLLHSVHPAKIAFSKVNWEARNDADYLANYKLLLQAFDRLKVDKAVDIQKLTRGKYMDNLEMMQWFKWWWDTEGGADEDYDPVAAREKCKGGSRVNKGRGGGKPGARPSASSSTARRSSGTASSTPAGSAPARRPSNRASGTAGGTPPPAASAASKALTEELQRKVDELSKNAEELSQSADTLEKERDFYFDKLRDIEMLLQGEEDERGETPLTKRIFKVLYATTDDFVPLEEICEAAAPSPPRTQRPEQQPPSDNQSSCKEEEEEEPNDGVPGKTPDLKENKAEDKDEESPTTQEDNAQEDKGAETPRAEPSAEESDEAAIRAAGALEAEKEEKLLTA